MARKEARNFVVSNTRPLHPPLVPEVILHLAEESLPIWRKTEEELGEIDVPPPYWAFAWAGGQALARYIIDTPATVAGKTVLDIGSGSGLVAIAATLAGARRVIANDVDTFAVAAGRLNAAANDVAVEFLAADLLAPTGDVTARPDCDVILLGDLFYDRDLSARALAFAADARHTGHRVLVGDPRRSYFPADRFRKLADYAVPVTRELEDSEIKKTAVWEFLS